MVVFIDDLDRCKPDKIVEVHFCDSCPCFV
jgi:hypothetical protein